MAVNTIVKGPFMIIKSQFLKVVQLVAWLVFLTISVLIVTFLLTLVLLVHGSQGSVFPFAFLSDATSLYFSLSCCCYLISYVVILSCKKLMNEDKKTQMKDQCHYRVNSLICEYIKWGFSQ